MPVSWLSTAIEDLDEILAYVSRDDPAAALRLADQIDDQVARLAAHPALGRPDRVDGTREKVISGTPFLAIYTVGSGNAVLDIRLLHGARRWPPETA